MAKKKRKKKKEYAFIGEVHAHKLLDLSLFFPDEIITFLAILLFLVSNNTNMACTH